jgi:two-component system sensor histidine kinase YesM
MGYLLSVMRKDVLFSPLWEADLEDLFTWIGVFNSEGRTVFTEGVEPDLRAVLTALESRRAGLSGLESGSGRLLFNARIGSQRYIVTVKPIPRAGWFVVGLSPFSMAMGDLYLAFHSILLIGAGFLVVGILVSYFIARTITHPLAEVTGAMRAFDERGSLEKIGLNIKGELGYLVRVYNKMVESINESIRNIYEEQEKKKEAELRSLEYELDFLQAQINPHFIYNTLNAIGYQAEKAGNTKVYESLRSFNILLKAAVSGIGELVPVHHELTLVENFLLIQRLRYGDRFDVEYVVPRHLLEARVPKLILQPVVENAIFHGIEPSERHGMIRISARCSNDHLVLEVADNGVGFDQADSDGYGFRRTAGEGSGFDQARDRVGVRGDDGKRKFNRIGLANVNERVKILFGSGYGLRVTSRPGEGTKVTIDLPRGEV